MREETHMPVGLSLVHFETDGNLTERFSRLSALQQGGRGARAIGSGSGLWRVGRSDFKSLLRVQRERQRCNEGDADNGYVQPGHGNLQGAAAERGGVQEMKSVLKEKFAEFAFGYRSVTNV